MIRNWKQKQLNIDYSRLNFGRGQPSDIDFMYRGRNHILLLGEIKNERGTFTDWQRKMYEDIADNYKGHCIILYITHNKRVEDGDTEVDLSEAIVREMYYNGSWHCIERNLQDVIRYYS